MFVVAFTFDATQCNASGVIKATGRQGIGSMCSLGCMMFIALPVGYYCAFVKEFGLSGLWLGYGLSAFCLSTLYGTVLINMDWHKTAEEASSSEESTQDDTQDDDDFKRVYDTIDIPKTNDDIGAEDHFKR